MQEMSFEYGGYHFIPERRFTKQEDDFFKITRRLRSDTELGFLPPTITAGEARNSLILTMIFMLHPRIRNAIFSAAWRMAGFTSPASMNCNNIWTENSRKYHKGIPLCPENVGKSRKGGTLMNGETRSNQGYEIIESCTIGNTELVIGHHPKAPNPYVQCH